MKPTTPTKIRISGLPKLDVLEMSDEFPKDSVSLANERMPGAEHGELATTAIIVVSALTIKALATWLMKNRKKNRITKTIEIIDASGATRIETIDIDLSSSVAPEADVLKQLSKITKFDISDLLQHAS